MFAYNSPSKWSVPFQLSVGLDSVLQLCNAITKQSERKSGPGRTCYGRSSQEDELVHCPRLSQWFQPRDSAALGLSCGPVAAVWKGP